MKGATHLWHNHDIPALFSHPRQPERSSRHDIAAHGTLRQAFMVALCAVCGANARKSGLIARNSGAIVRSRGRARGIYALVRVILALEQVINAPRARVLEVKQCIYAFV